VSAADALREALEAWPQDGSVHEPGCGYFEREGACDCFTSIARAALAVSEPVAGDEGEFV
jgi:hypothetical protein